MPQVSMQTAVVVASYDPAADEPLPGAVVVSPDRLRELLAGGYSVHTLVGYEYPFRQTEADRARAFRSPRVVSVRCALALLYHPDRANAPAI